MGYIKHNAIVVCGHDLEESHEKAVSIFGHNRVSQIIKKLINSYESFFIAPDGSKEGWSESNENDHFRDEFMEYCRLHGIDAVDVRFGGDDMKISIKAV